jgi:glutamate racemase
MIGIFDSGLGGLTVVKEILKKYPKEDLVYLGDTARVPYGTRSPETIIKFSVECAQFLQKQGVDKIIIACNTASAYAYEEVKKAVKVPVWEIISYGARGAKEGKKIGVIGTRATINSGMYEKKIKEFNPEAEVISVATPLLVPLIEEGEIEGEIIQAVVKKSITGLEDVDTMVLGCTHYPIIGKFIYKKLVNPGEELVREWISEGGSGIDKYYFTDLPGRYINVAEMFLGQKLTGKVERVII